MITTTRVTRAAALAAALATTLILALLARAPAPDVAPDTASDTAPVATVNRLRVVAISLDGLNPRAILQLGAQRLPHLFQLFRQGAGTTNARAQVEMTVTLPNHTSMVTGRRIAAASGGHGVTWNTDRSGTTVPGAAGQPVSSVFSAVRAGGGRTTLFSTKSKFTLFSRSWPITKTVIRAEDDTTLTRLFRTDILGNTRAFAFLHLGLTDQVGHSSGWMSSAYLRAVVRLDALVGSVMATIRDTDRLRRSTVVILTSDHGGIPGSRSHDDPTRLDDYRVPFVVWGPGVDHAGLYDLNPDRRDPGTGRPGFSGRQPVRNGDLANLATRILGLGPVPGSLWNADQRLDWHR